MNQPLFMYVTCAYSSTNTKDAFSVKVAFNVMVAFCCCGKVRVLFLQSLD